MQDLFQQLLDDAPIADVVRRHLRSSGDLRIGIDRDVPSFQRGVAKLLAYHRDTTAPRVFETLYLLVARDRLAGRVVGWR